MSEPVVTVGAAVSVQNKATGVVETWTIVREGPSRERREISAASPVALALLGRSRGDTVTVAAVRPTRYTITGIVPPPPTLAKPAARPRPVPDARILVFGAGQDQDYEDWVRQHPSGYVIKKADRVADGYILHHAECLHLGLAADFTLRTASPRHCCSSLRVLERWCCEHAEAPPHRCRTCFS